jgi:calnexin
MEDPTDSKPDSWDESEPMYIDDVTAEMPAEWDESAPELLADESAKKPEARLQTGAVRLTNHQPLLLGLG